MKKSSQNSIHFGLLLLLVFLGYTFFGSKTRIPVKNETSDELLQASAVASMQATPQAQITNPATRTESSDTPSSSMMTEDSLFFPEKIAERKKNPLNLCAHLNGKAEKIANFERMINSPRLKEDSFEKTILLMHEMSLAHFQIDLPVTAKFYTERESGKVHTKAEITLNFQQRNIELRIITVEQR